MINIPNCFINDLEKLIKGEKISEAFQVYLNSYIGLEEIIKNQVNAIRSKRALLILATIEVNCPNK